MKIASFSLTEQNLFELERIRREFGMSNSSEAFRSALCVCTEKLDNEIPFCGKHQALLVIAHSHATTDFVSGIRHSFQELVKLQNHYCSSQKECLDFFLLEGQAKKIRKMRNSILKNKEIRKIVLIPL